MHYINTETHEEADEQGLHALYPNTSFPLPFCPPDGWAEVIEAAQPEYDADTQRLERTTAIQHEGEWRSGWRIVDLSEEERATYAAANRITITRTQGLVFLFRSIGIKESDIEAMLSEEANEDIAYEAGLYFRAATWDSDNAFVGLLCARVGLDTPQKLRQAFEAAKAI